MAVNVELWQPLIIEELFKSNEFLRYMLNVNQYVVGGRIVHIPQSGGPTGAEKNRTVFPGAIVTRNDTDITYPLDEYTSNPTRIPHMDTVELSYDKRASVLNENWSELLELVGENILYDTSKECPAAQKIATTGADAAATVDGSTGTRKIITEADIRKARTMLNKQNVSKKGRYLVLSSEMMDQLQSDNNLRYAFQKTVDLKEGTLPKLFGFQLIERSSVLSVDNSQTIKAPGAAPATTDSDAALFFQKNSLERALGEVKIFERTDDPEYYGDIFSLLVRAGSRNRREDDKGYGIIYRAA